MRFAGAACIVLIFAFPHVAYRLGLYRYGFDATVLAVGSCLVILAAAQSRRNASRPFWPLLWLGRHSYEIYLTHMFVFLWMVQWFTSLGSPMRWSLVWYVAMLALSGLLGAAIANGFSNPLNQWIRKQTISR